MTTVTAAVYSAENQLSDLLSLADETEVRTYEFYGSKLELPIERKFASLESIETYCNTVLKLRQVRERYPIQAAKPITVRARKTDRSAHYQRGEIAICPNGSRWALREMVVLHELAHHLAIGDDHGRKFQTAYAFLLTECVGPEVGIIMHAFFDKNLAE